MCMCLARGRVGSQWVRGLGLLILSILAQLLSEKLNKL